MASYERKERSVGARLGVERTKGRGAIAIMGELYGLAQTQKDEKLATVAA